MNEIGEKTYNALYGIQYLKYTYTWYLGIEISRGGIMKSRNQGRFTHRNILKKYGFFLENDNE